MSRCVRIASLCSRRFREGGWGDLEREKFGEDSGLMVKCRLQVSTSLMQVDCQDFYTHKHHTSCFNNFYQVFKYEVAPSLIFTDLTLLDEAEQTKISYLGASLFNSLLSELKDIENSNSIYSYKKKLKSYFLQLNYQEDHTNKFPRTECKHIIHCQCYSQ